MLIRPSTASSDDGSDSHEAPRSPLVSTNVVTCASTGVSARPAGTAHGAETCFASAPTAGSVATVHARAVPLMPCHR